MSSLAKIIIALVIVAVICIGVGAWYGQRNTALAPEQTSDTASGKEVTSTSNVDDDVNTFDAEISAVSSGSAAVDQGMNDKQIEQESI